MDNRASKVLPSPRSWQLHCTALAGLLFVVVAAAFGLRDKQDRPTDPKATVLFFLSTDCPVAMQYSPRIQRLVAEYGAKGVTFKAYFPNELETKGGIEKYAMDRKYDFPVLIDLEGRRAKELGVTIVPTVFVLDANKKIVYSGAIDDNKDASLVKKPFLTQALDATVEGKKPAVASTKPFGCVLMAGTPLPSGSNVTYAEHIKPVLDRSCVPCHRPGAVAPFSLVGYDNAKKWAPMIEIVTQNRKMPPWKAVHAPGEFIGDNTLSEAELELVKRWNAAKAPRGNVRSERPDPKFSSSEWPLGKPDLILTPAESYTVKADGADDYRHFILTTNFSETKYVKLIAVAPGNHKVVHHVIAFLDSTGASHRLDRRDGKVGYSTFGGPGFLPSGSLGGWAPGYQGQALPEGKAMAIPPKTTIVMQVHYHPTGKEETDLTKLGLYFAKETVDQEVELSWMANYRLNIPAGAKDHTVRHTTTVPSDITLYTLMPHMHLLGKSMTATVEFPDQRKEVLLAIRDWDFNWQLQYMFSTPKKIPGGSKIHVEATYDNSAENPNNPSNPPKQVRWGEETTDEMQLLVAAYTVDGARKPVGNPFGFGRKPNP